MAIDKNFLSELRLRLPLSAVIGQRIKITRAGREYKACCPFHEEKSPSFYVNDDKGFFHCFGCGAHGDIVGFRMRYDNVSFREAVEALARDAGLPLPDYKPADPERVDRNRALQKIMELATLWFEAQLHLPANAFAMDYLVKRGLSAETIRAFRIGYAPNHWDALREALLKQKIPLDQLVETGLLKSSEKPDKLPYAFFRGRIMFPVADRQGLTIAFGGRHLDAAFDPSELNSTTGYKPAKYINSAEYALFNKGAQLYSLSRARGSLSGSNKQDGPLLIVEGYMDVIALHQAGFKTAVAPLGTALTEQQIQLAWQVSAQDNRPPVLCFDGDKAGLNAAYRALDRMLPFLGTDRQARFAFLPQGEDPDTLVKTGGRPAFQTVLDQAKTVFEVLWQRATTEHGTATPEDQARVQAAINAGIALIPDKNLQYVYGQELRNRMYQLRKPAFTPRAGASRTAPVHHPVHMTSPKNLARDNPQVKIMFALVLNHPWVLRDHAEQFAQIPLPDDEGLDLHDLQHALLDADGARDAGDPADQRQSVLEYLSNQGFDPIVNTLLTERVYKHAGFARPQAEQAHVMEGWHNIWNAIQRDLVQRDMTETERLAKNSIEHAERLWEMTKQRLSAGDTDSDEQS